MNYQVSNHLYSDLSQILVVDDELRICQSLKNLLSKRRYNVQTCQSGTQALTLVSDQHFDLALIDVFMEDMTGFQLFEKLTARDIDIRVIIMTGKSSTDSAVKALRMGVDDYLKKPFKVEELYKTVGQVLEQLWLARQLSWNEQKYRALFKSSFDAIYIIDSETGIIVDCNAAAVMHHGKQSKSDIIGTTHVSLSSQEQDNGLPCEQLAGKYFSQALKTGRKEFEWIYCRDDGSRFHTLVSLTVFHMAEKKFFMQVSKDNTYRKQAQQGREKLIQALQKSLENVKTLSGLLPICANCKKIRDDKGYWKHLEAHIQEHSYVFFSHSLCPECSDHLYGQEDWYRDLLSKKSKN